LRRRFADSNRPCLCKKNMALFLTHLEAEECRNQRAVE
jgi:hypothetical protein